MSRILLPYGALRVIIHSNQAIPINLAGHPENALYAVPSLFGSAE